MVEERRKVTDKVAETPLRRVAAIVEYPYAGRYVDDLEPMIEASAAIGQKFGQIGLRASGNFEVQSSGKGGIVGLVAECRIPQSFAADR